MSPRIDTYKAHRSPREPDDAKDGAASEIGDAVQKVVITAAGLGTRLLPMSKELPKEMLPLFIKNKSGVTLKPLLQALFEQFYDLGFRQFCIVIGRGKRAIEDHFTPDYSFLEALSRNGKSDRLESLKTFYHKIESSKILWVNQPQPKGFGDAVLQAKSFIAQEDFMVAAADTYIASKDIGCLKSLVQIHRDNNADASFLAMKVPDPENYGVIEASNKGEYLRVLSAVEKPKNPKTNLAILPFYIFKPSIFRFLESAKSGAGGEIQLTDAINNLIHSGAKVCALLLGDSSSRLDIGTPETYWNAISLSHLYSVEK